MTGTRGWLPVLGLLLAGCRCGGPPPGQQASVENLAKETTAQPAMPILPETGTVLWGPRSISNPDRTADGLSTAAGMEKSAVVWIEQRNPGADVYLARIGTDPDVDVTRVTRDTSSYPPTAVVHSGKDFMLAWGDDRYRHIEVFVARVGEDGRIDLAPRRLTVTTVPDDAPGGVLTVDSSQEPTLASVEDQLIAVWGGPGDVGRQQVYMTTLSASGKPMDVPVALTSGQTDAVSMRLGSSGSTALLTYCVQGARGAEMFRLDLEGSPPVPSVPESLGLSQYVPCTLTHTVAGDATVLFWAERSQDAGGAVEDGIMGRRLEVAGELSKARFELPGVRLLKFPGKHHTPFDVLGLDANRVAVTWVQRVHDGSRELRLQVFSPDGVSLTQPLVLTTRSDPTDPHLVATSETGKLLVLFLDREAGSQSIQVRAALVSVS